MVKKMLAQRSDLIKQAGTFFLPFLPLNPALTGNVSAWFLPISRSTGNGCVQTTIHLPSGSHGWLWGSLRSLTNHI